MIVAVSIGALSGSIITILGLVISAIALIALIVYARRYIGAQSIKAQLDAKDAIIDTHKQNVEALSLRVDTLEDDLGRLMEGTAKRDERIADLEGQLRKSEARYDVLKEYAAPSLEKTLIEIHDTLGILLDRSSPVP